MVAIGESAVSTLEITVSQNLLSLLCFLLPLFSISSRALDATGSSVLYTKRWKKGAVEVKISFVVIRAKCAKGLS